MLYKKVDQKRNWLETVNVILTISTNGIKKTHIMYKANLSHQQLEKFLSIMVSKNLLKKRNYSFETTEKGLVFIEEFRKIECLLEENNLDYENKSIIANTSIIK